MPIYQKRKKKTMPAPNPTRKYLSKLTLKEVRKLSQLLGIEIPESPRHLKFNLVREFSKKLGGKEISEIYKERTGCISRIITRKRWKHI